MWDRCLASPKFFTLRAPAAVQRTPCPTDPLPSGPVGGADTWRKSCPFASDVKTRVVRSREARELHASNHRDPGGRQEHESLSHTAKNLEAAGWQGQDNMAGWGGAEQEEEPEEV